MKSSNISENQMPANFRTKYKIDLNELSKI